MQKRILIVDDEPAIRDMVAFALRKGEFEPAHAGDAREAQSAIADRVPDLILLDWMLPGTSGLELARRWRREELTREVPIIMLTARGEENDRVGGLEAGVDDYVVKPFGIGELMARVRAASRQRSAAASDPDRLRVGGLSIDLTRRLAVRDGVEQRLSPKEHALLSLFVHNRDKILTHAQILREVWGPAHTHDTAYLRVYVNQLRQKLEADPGRPVLIVTEPGVGYRLRTGEER